MVMLARVNMALQRAPKAKIFYTDNSLTTKAFKANSFDLICTNPPFGTPKFTSDKKGKESKERYEAQMEQVLGGFRPAKLETEYVAYYDYVKKTWQDLGNLDLDEDGSPKWPGYRTDLRNVSTGKRRSTTCSPPPVVWPWAASPMAKVTGNRWVPPSTRLCCLLTAACNCCAPVAAY